MRALILTILILTTLPVFGQGVWMHPNRGQWHENIEFKLDLALGELYIEKTGLLFNLSDAKQHFSHHHDNEFEHEEEHYRSHVIRSTFVGAVEPSEIVERDSSSFYRNYILGNDKRNWKSAIYSVADVQMTEIYPGIDVRYETKPGNLKYSFVVAANRDASNIRIKWDGHHKAFIDDEGRLHVSNEFGDIIEDKPVAWTFDENGRVEKVDVAFKPAGGQQMAL